MSRNKTSISGVPKIHHSRSMFDLSFSNATTFKHGDLVPLCRPIEVLPGDTFSIDVSTVLRMNTPISPVMGSSFFDIYFFFTPNRIVFDKWEQLQGQNDDGAWTENYNHIIPVGGDYSDQVLDAGMIGHYFGLPAGLHCSSNPVNELPLRAYVRIWNDFFRDQNWQNPVKIQYGTGNNESIIGYNVDCLRVNKLHDLYTSTLPGSQKGPQVSVPLGDKAFIYADNTYSSAIASSQALYLTPKRNGGSWPVNTQVPISVGPSGTGTYSPNIQPYADLSTATAASINALRMAFAAQAYYEALSRSGSRYIELLRNIWSVDPGDARLQRPEYLGGKRIPINVDEIANTAGNSSTGTTFNNATQLGSVGAKSKTVDVSSMFTKSFTEHGMLICVGCARALHGYTQGLDPIWTKKDKFDFYLPQFANIGEVSVPRGEVYFTGTNADKDTFGFQEAWYEYRYLKNMATGNMDPSSTNPLSTWTYYDKYVGGSFGCSGDWLYEPRAYVDRTLNFSTGFEYIADFYFNIKAARLMPVYSIPSNIDHY